MLVKQLLEVYNVLDVNDASGETVEAYLGGIREGADIHVYPLAGPKGKADIVKVRIHGSRGRTPGGDAPTLGLLGCLRGLGTRPERIGFVPDGDGALVALSLIAELLDIQNKDDILKGDIIISIRVCPNAPIRPHRPVVLMDSPVEMAQVNKKELSNEFGAVLSVDTIRGSWIINTRGLAISPTVKRGYVLKASESVPDTMQITIGRLPCVYTLSVQDIMPYGNSLYHLNSILQPATGIKAPVVGAATTTEIPVTGYATRATHIVDCEEAVRLMLEVAKAHTRGECSFYDEDGFTRTRKLYGNVSYLQTLGKDT